MSDLPDPSSLERLRASSGLSLDAEGRFLHRGELITHARTLEALRRTFHREPDGRYAVSIGRELAYVTLEAAPYAVLGIRSRPGDEPLLLRLSDGTEEPLDPGALAVGPDGVLRCTVKGDHAARFTRAGQVALGALMEEDPPGAGRYTLVVNGRRWRVREAG